MAWAARSSGRVALNEPRTDLARGVRELATMTASLMTDLTWENRGTRGPRPQAGQVAGLAANSRRIAGDSPGPGQGRPEGQWYRRRTSARRGGAENRSRNSR